MSLTEFKKRPVVVLTDYMYESIQPFYDVFDEADIDFRTYQCKTAEEVILASAEADAILVHFAPITKEVITSLPNLKLIVRSAVGMDNIDVDAAQAAGLPAANVPDYGIEDVATHTILLMLAITKNLQKLTDTVKKGIWDYSVAKPAHRIQGKTLGLVGCGRIARCVAQKAHAFGMNVIAYDPYLKQDQVDSLGIVLKSLDDVAAESDVVSLHLLLNKETTGLINREFFRKMKSSAYLINTARGGVVNEEDLIEALTSHQIAGAGLDALNTESLPIEHPLQKLDNVIITPHAAWYSEEAQHTLLTSAAEEVVRGLRGEPLKHPFNNIPYARNV